MIRRLIVLSALSVIAFAPAAYAGHGEELDGCDHGATSKPCRPDPSPHGQDCDVHGNHGGVNEDHCDTEVTPSTSTTTTAPAPTTTTTTVTDAPTTTTTSSQTGGPTTTTSRPVPTTSPTGSHESAPTTLAELPRTGFGSTLLVFFGLWLLLGGAVSLLVGAWLGR